MRKKFELGAIAAAAVFGAGAALAAGQDRGVPGADVDVNATMDMSSVDKNSDGKITKSEASSNKDLSGQFSKLDTNKDGSLDQGEFAKFEAKGSAGGTSTGDEAPNTTNRSGTTDDSTPGNKDKLGPGR
jgi:hypothetical protein